MKRLPMMRPAIEVDMVDRRIRRVGPKNFLSRRFLYPKAQEEMSKKRLAAVNPRKWNAVGLRRRLMMVAISPIAEAESGLLVHQMVRMRRDVASISQRIGRRVTCQNMGATVTFRMAQVEAARDMAAISLVPNLNIAPSPKVL